LSERTEIAIWRSARFYAGSLKGSSTQFARALATIPPHPVTGSSRRGTQGRGKKGELLNGGHDREYLR
jgi:hypothetical protein